MYEGIVDKSNWLYGFANMFEMFNIGKNSRPNIKLNTSSSMGWNTKPSWPIIQCHNCYALY